jgi:hypothetical protein
MEMNAGLSGFCHGRKKPWTAAVIAALRGWGSFFGIRSVPCRHECGLIWEDGRNFLEKRSASPKAVMRFAFTALQRLSQLKIEPISHAMDRDEMDRFCGIGFQFLAEGEDLVVYGAVGGKGVVFPCLV